MARRSHPSARHPIAAGYTVGMGTLLAVDSTGAAVAHLDEVTWV